MYINKPKYKLMDNRKSPSISVKFIALCLFLIPLFSPDTSHAKESIESINFKTKFVQNNFRFPFNLIQYEDSFNDALSSMPEGPLVLATLSLGATSFGISQKKVSQMLPEFQKLYVEMGSDNLFRNIKSALPYCISNKKKSGHYFLYRPEKETTDPILFLHGYGGNPLFFLWILKQEFTNSTIICPSSGIGWGRDSNRYIDDMMSSLATKDIFISKLWLMAISQGGPAGFRYYSNNQKKVRAFFSIVSCPQRPQLKSIKTGSTIFMINGKEDKRFPYKFILPYVRLLNRNTDINFQHQGITGDHFIFITKRKNLFSYIKEKMGILTN